MEGWDRNFEDMVDWKLGTRKDVLFWEDYWAGCGVLKGAFPRLTHLFFECRFAWLLSSYCGEW